MTPRELADKILNHFNIYPYDSTMEQLESLLAEALAEARKSKECEADENEAQWCHDCAYKAQEKAKAVAYEECAKIAEGFWDHVPQEEYDRGFEPDTFTPKEIAKGIRLRAQELK